MIKPVQFGIYYVSPKEYLDNIGVYDEKAISEKWLREDRPFVCVYQKSTPYFIPLYSIKPSDDSTHSNKMAKWNKYAFLDMLDGTHSFMPFERLLNNSHNYYSVARINKMIPVPPDMLKERKTKKGHLVKISQTHGARLAKATSAYFNQTKSLVNGNVRVVGYLAHLDKKTKVTSYPTNHPLLLKATLEYQRRKEEAKQKNQNTLMEEKEK